MVEHIFWPEKLMLRAVPVCPLGQKTGSLVLSAYHLLKRSNQFLFPKIYNSEKDIIVFSHLFGQK